ncbi:hypothetical protein B0F90DRAFT_1337083 [Multifurca ochricompacta]|uniref:Transmembrane protein n=1 Tax=Multifurca ochricompacta TaxID=376703 RepID=A0AAD4LY59_9AGAM|nr:hypothetical protein B0F90DRAFT_1337083 [Multifurca ochricompacta]
MLSPVESWSSFRHFTHSNCCCLKTSHGDYFPDCPQTVTGIERLNPRPRAKCKGPQLVDSVSRSRAELEGRRPPQIVRSSGRLSIVIITWPAMGIPLICRPFSLQLVGGSFLSAMCRSLLLSIASISLSQAAAATFEWPVNDVATSTAARVCETASLLARPSMRSISFHPVRIINGSSKMSSSMIGAVNVPTDVHHRVGVIVGASLGAAGGVLLLGLIFFWILLRHRHHMAIAHVQDVVPRSWTSSDSIGDQDIEAVANHPSLSLDLTGAGTQNGSVVPASASVQSAEEAKRWNKSTDVLDISLENPAPPTPFSSSPTHSLSRQPLPDPIEPYVPSQVSQRTPILRIRTNVVQTSLLPGSQLSTSAHSPLSPIRPLPTPPTTPRMRRPRSAKAEEAHREFRRSRLSRSVVSAEDLRVYQQDRRRSRAHSIISGSGEVDEFEIVQHHDGGMNARIDLPPPYHECLQAHASTPTLPSPSQVTS